MDKELLQAIGQMMDEKFKQELGPINTRLDNIDSRLDGIEQRVVEMGIIQENVTNPNIALIQEGLDRIEGRLKKQDKMEATLEEHDRRIWAVEMAVKKALP